MKAGTVIRLPDGRYGTVVYNGLDGVGIIWGQVRLTTEELEMIYGSCPLFDHGAAKDFPHDLEPQALLREPWDNAYMECVGEEFEVVWKPPELAKNGKVKK